MLTYLLSTLDDPDDQAFLTQLYKDYYLLMFATAKKYLPNQADREDAVQASMEHLIHHAGKLRTMSHYALLSYLVTTVRNTCFNLITANVRKERHLAPLEDNPEMDRIVDESSIEDLLTTLHRQDVMALVWSQLSEEEQFLLKGKYVIGYSDAELAASLGCRPDSIRMKLTRVRRKAVTLAAQQED